MTAGSSSGVLADVMTRAAADRESTVARGKMKHPISHGRQLDELKAEVLRLAPEGRVDLERELPASLDALSDSATERLCLDEADAPPGAAREWQRYC